MILKAYYDHLAAVMLNRICEYVDTSGVLKLSDASYTKQRFDFSKMASVTKSKDNSGVAFGTGGTEPALNDYFLSGELITTISGNGSVTITNDDTGMTIKSLLTVTNTGENEITIKEVGYICNYNTAAMFDRAVLDSPITIPAGGVGQITYTIRMNYPTA